MTHWVLLLLLLLAPLARATDYSVTNDPYASVNWGTTLRCLSQTHDHVDDSASFVSSYAAAGYCATTAATYSGFFRAMTAGEWATAGNPNPDPGVVVGWNSRRWPPQDFGQPTLPSGTLSFYLPGAEEIYMAGVATAFSTQHLYSIGPVTLPYVEGEGCSSCGQTGIPVHNNNPLSLPEGQIARGANGALLQNDGINKMNALGAFVTLNHPFSAGGVTAFDPYTVTTHSMEVYNNYHKLWDEGSANNGALASGGAACDGSASFPWNTTYIPFFSTLWDHWLQTRSARIWGVAVNDHAGPWRATGIPGTVCWPVITTANRDRGKLEMLVTSLDLTAWLSAYDSGAFFAIAEDNATKNAYPQVTDINVTADQIEILTAAGTETITWKSNGSTIGTGSAFSLNGLSSGLQYVRAEITDGAGRTLWVQPFELQTDLPPTDSLPLCESQQ